MLVQRRFTERLRGMTQLSYAVRLTALHIDSLEYRRLVADLLITHKILFVLSDLESSDYFTIYIGDKFRLRGKVYRSSVRSNFCILGPWNALPVNIANFHSFNAFKISLKKVDFSNFLTSLL